MLCTLFGHLRGFLSDFALFALDRFDFGLWSLNLARIFVEAAVALSVEGFELRLLLGLDLLRIADAGVVHPGELAHEGVFDGSQLSEGEGALVELVVEELIDDDLVNEAADASWGWIFEAAGGGFDAVTDEDDRGFFGPWFGPGVTEHVLVGDGQVVRLGVVDGLAVEELAGGGAVVLGDEVDDLLGQVQRVGELDAVFNVGVDDECGEGRGEAPVFFGAEGVVLGEVVGFGHFANVVIVGTDADEQAVGADVFGGGFAKLGDHLAVVIGARGLHVEAAE